LDEKTNGITQVSCQKIANAAKINICGIVEGMHRLRQELASSANKRLNIIYRNKSMAKL
jgi:hypothetical protein